MSWRNELVTPEVARLMDRIVDSAFRVHRALGPGYLESIYRRCLAHALRRDGMDVDEEVWLPVAFEGARSERALRADLVVGGTIIVEVKAVETLAPVHRAQVISYLKASGLPAGALFNFNVAYFREGNDRLVHPDLVRKSREDSGIRGFAGPFAGSDRRGDAT